MVSQFCVTFNIKALKFNSLQKLFSKIDFHHIYNLTNLYKIVFLLDQFRFPWQEKVDIASNPKVTCGFWAWHALSENCLGLWALRIWVQIGKLTPNVFKRVVSGVIDSPKLRNRHTAVWRGTCREWFHGLLGETRSSQELWFDTIELLCPVRIHKLHGEFKYHLITFYYPIVLNIAEGMLGYSFKLNFTIEKSRASLKDRIFQYAGVKYSLPMFIYSTFSNRNLKFFCKKMNCWYYFLLKSKHAGNNCWLQSVSNWK